MTDRRTLVQGWLKKQGYGLEYAVARELRGNRFNVARGRVYQDPQSPDTWREVDIDAELPAQFLTLRATLDGLARDLAAQARRELGG